MSTEPADFPTMDRELLAALPALPHIDFRDLRTARTVLEAAAADQLARLPDLEKRWGVRIEQSRAPGEVPFLLFQPPPGPTAVPALMWVHGGGFAVGAAALEAEFCAELSARAKAVVAVPDYRLAPEHPFPAALDDCYATLRSLHDGAARVDTERLAVGGQSAGGGLAAATALLARDRGEIGVQHLVLESPELDDRLTTHSMKTFTTTPVWTRAAAELSWAHYLGSDRDEVPPYAVPARAETLAGLPPTYIGLAELDPLRDEGLDFARRLLHSGVSVELHLFPGTFHRSSTVPAAVSRRSRTEIIETVARRLRTR
ncbi:alpha/beta hydrolase [Actinomadura vinacea]|uniref:Alpha/beta hydrolase n=1 Tax=Actinomadura vinacea TaxID=115336 RepID=A0ABN3IQS1_9ACTN